MIKTFRKNAQPKRVTALRFMLIGALALAIAGCAPGSGDGDTVDAINLPVGELALDLYCEDFALANESCVLDDPDNPFARAAIDWGNTEPVPTGKFGFYNLVLLPELEGIYGSPIPAGIKEKIDVYYWATAQAIAPNGENQWLVAQALYLLANQSCSQLIQDQAQRAYRSILDNYFGQVTFFSTADFTSAFAEVLYPFPLAVLSANQLRLGVGGAAAGCGATGYSEFMFDPDGARNDFVARVVLNDWGYVYDPAAGSVTQK